MSVFTKGFVEVLPGTFKVDNLGASQFGQPRILAPPLWSWSGWKTQRETQLYEYPKLTLGFILPGTNCLDFLAIC
jgi:hypothetical protein